jgi:hypothetical protein
MLTGMVETMLEPKPEAMSEMLHPFMSDAELQQWAQRYHRFAAEECPHEPLYVALCHAVAEAPDLLALMRYVPAVQARPNILLAALHERVLAGVSHALASYYPSVGGTRPPDAELAPALRDFVRAEHQQLVAHLRKRSTQTNEIGRCAVLTLALSEIAKCCGQPELALFDFGCSAGLNLGVDAYRYDYGHFERGQCIDDQTPTVHCEWRHLGAQPPNAPWRLHSRMGVDLEPVDLFDEASVRWLRACLWPHDRVRAHRLELAIQRARPANHLVRQSAQGLDLLASWLNTLPVGVQPVLFNSWVLAYMDAPQLAMHRAQVEALMRSRGLIWLSAETAPLRPPGLSVPPAPADEQASGATLWTLQWADGPGTLQACSVAWSHAHGHWVHWLAPRA